MLGSFDYVKKLFSYIESQPKLNSEFCIVFVYNSPETMFDTVHDTECIFPEELHMITSSFEKIAETVIAIDGESNFLKSIYAIKEKYKYVLVYSMAQNLKGNGRRSLIPLICDYLHLINIGADFLSATLGRSKHLMYKILSPLGYPFPKTYWINNSSDIDDIIPQIENDKWLLKPSNESSSIGLKVCNFNTLSHSDIKIMLADYLHKYKIFCVQEFIEGEEVAVPMLKINDKYYSPGISQVDFPQNVNYINYDMIASGSYGYFEYTGNIKEKLLQLSANVADELNFTAMSRIDFRIRENIPYIEDIGVNPTISTDNGVNQLYCAHLHAQPWAIYAILTYAALISCDLLEPPFHHTPDQRIDN